MWVFSPLRKVDIYEGAGTLFLEKRVAVEFRCEKEAEIPQISENLDKLNRKYLRGSIPQEVSEEMFFCVIWVNRPFYKPKFNL